MERRTLTVKGVENLRPKPTRYEIADGRVRGLRVVVQPSGEKGFVLRYRFQRRSRKLLIGPAGPGGLTLQQARDTALVALAELARGADPGTQKQQAMALAAAAEAQVTNRIAAVAEQYLQRQARRLRPSSYRQVQRIIRREIVPRWGTRRASDITRADVTDAFEEVANVPR